MTAPAEAGGTVDRAVERFSRTLAERLTRRSAVARLGGYGVALSLGAAGVALLEPDRARADPCGCGGCKNVSCGCNLSIWCNAGGDCPSGTCHCGGWTFSCSCSSNGHSGCWWYGDCCGDCGAGSSCLCYSDTCGNSPSCCNQPEWYFNAFCNNICNCNNPWHIYCRRKYCNTDAGACGSPASCCTSGEHHCDCS